MEKFGSQEQPNKREELLAKLRELNKEQIIGGEDWTREKAKELKELNALLIENGELTEKEREEFKNLIKKQLEGGREWTERDQERIKELYERI